MQTVVGLFRRLEEAQHVVEDLHRAGFDNKDISLIARDEKGDYTRHMEGGKSEDVSDGAAAGAGIGAVLGGIGGLLIGLGALAIPGIGPVIAAGPIISALAGAGIGAVAGGLVGALVDLGVPEEHATAYSEGVKRGGTLVVVRTDDTRANEALQIMNRHNPVNIEGDEFDRLGQTDMTQTAYQGSAVPVTGRDQDMDSDYDKTRMHEEHLTDDEIPVTGARDMDIPVIEEDIRVGKRDVERGGVRVEKHTEEVPFEEDVHLRDETINVERRPVNREATEKDFDAFKEGSVEFTERDEEAIVEKRARVVEEVHIDKDVEERTETIRDTVRRQDVDVTRIDNDMRTYDKDFRSHYQTSYASRGRDYDSYYMPAYRYGYILSQDNRYRGRDWNQVEPEARREWERQGNQSPWEEVKDAVRHAWQRARR